MRDALNSMLTGIAVQLVQNAWDTLTKSCSLGPPGVVIERYLCFNPAVIQFRVLSRRSDGCVLLRKEETLFEERPPLQGSDGVDGTAKTGY